MEDQTQLTALDPLVDIPPALVTELAVGVGKFEDICHRYGYDDEQIKFLQNSPALQRRVAAMETELTKDGYTHEYRSRFVSDVALQVMHQRLIDPTTPTSQVVDIYKETVKTGNLLPKQNQQQVTSGGYSITINIPKLDDLPGRIIEAKAEPMPVLSTNDPIFGMDVNRDVNRLVDAEPALVAASSENMNRNVNSALALPEDWQDE